MQYICTTFLIANQLDWIKSIGNSQVTNRNAIIYDFLYNLRLMINFMTTCLCKTQHFAQAWFVQKDRIVKCRLTGVTQKAFDVMLNSCTLIYVQNSDVASVGLVRPTRD